MGFDPAPRGSFLRNLETTEAIAALEGEMRRYHRRRMKIAVHAVVATVIAAAFLAAIASAQATDSVPSQADSNMACVERLEIPRYPALATQARIEATVTASVLISPEGLPKDSGTEAESKFTRASSLFAPPVWKAINEGKFRPDCAGKIVKLVFHFRLQGASAGKPWQSVSFQYPNAFWIVSETQHVQPDQQVGAR